MRSRSEYIALIHQYFEGTARKYGVTQMALFGSVARNEQSETSDVDIAYEGTPDLFLRIRMKNELEKLLGCEVDLVRLRKQLAGTLFDEELKKDLIYV